MQSLILAKQKWTEGRNVSYIHDIYPFGPITFFAWKVFSVFQIVNFPVSHQFQINNTLQYLFLIQFHEFRMMPARPHLPEMEHVTLQKSVQPEVYLNLLNE